MRFSIQPTLENDFVRLVPLEKDDFEPLFAVALTEDLGTTSQQGPV
jgi:hypothetical protein